MTAKRSAACKIKSRQDRLAARTGHGKSFVVSSDLVHSFLVANFMDGEPVTCSLAVMQEFVCRRHFVFEHKDWWTRLAVLLCWPAIGRTEPGFNAWWWQAAMVTWNGPKVGRQALFSLATFCGTWAEHVWNLTKHACLSYDWRLLNPMSGCNLSALSLTARMSFGASGKSSTV